MNRDKLKNRIAEEFSQARSSRGVYALISKDEDYSIANQEAVRFLDKTLKSSGIYVTLSKPHCDIIKKLEEQDINAKKLLFIDNYESGKCGARNCIFLGRNNSLTAISLAITEASKDESMKFIFFDSINTMLIYNELETVERFVHYLINKVKNLEILLVMTLIEEEKTKKLIPLLSQFCDKVIRL